MPLDEAELDAPVDEPEVREVVFVVVVVLTVVGVRVVGTFVGAVPERAVVSVALAPTDCALESWLS